MHVHDPEGFSQREPTSKKIRRFPKYPVGIHERWSADGHDKLYKIGFPIYGIVDDATGKSLGAWVLPSNRLGFLIAYCFLCVVEKYGGKSNCISPGVAIDVLTPIQEYLCKQQPTMDQRRHKCMDL